MKKLRRNDLYIFAQDGKRTIAVKGYFFKDNGYELVKSESDTFYVIKKDEESKELHVIGKILDVVNFSDPE